MLHVLIQPLFLGLCRVTITELTWSIIRGNVSGIITVTEQEVIDAMRMVSG